MSRQAGLKLTGSLRKRLAGWYWSPSCGTIPLPALVSSLPMEAVNRTEVKGKILCDAHSPMQWSTVIEGIVNILQGRPFDVAAGGGGDY